MTLLRFCSVVASGALLLTACGDDDGSSPRDTGTIDRFVPDVGRTPDASAPDAGGVDMSMPPMDLGPDDGATPDMGAELDAGEDGGADVGPMDAGPPPPPFVISNVGDFGPLEETGLVVGPPSGTFDTDDGCTDDSGLGRCAPVALVGPAADACVCRADEIVIGSLRIVGSRSLVLLAWRSIEVVSTLDVGGTLGRAGPGSEAVYAATASSRAGGAGGSFGTAGGGSSAEVYGNEELVPLVGGMTGQPGCGSPPGGGGGGALQLSAGESIRIAGVVTAGGGGGSGGASGDTCHGGSGGGSGGAVIIEAPRVEVRGSVAANGGGAGSGGTTEFSGIGGNDATSTSAASGGGSRSDDSCALGATVLSGAGGTGGSAAAPAGSGGPTDEETICLPSGDTFAGAGGGGGGLGRLRINTADASRGCVCIGGFSPSATFGTIAMP